MDARGQMGRGLSVRRDRKEPQVGKRRGRAAAGGWPLPRSGACILSKRAWAALARSLNLSAREQQLVRGVFDDATDFSIAAALGISAHTVHTHFERLHLKLGVANRAQLILRLMAEVLSLMASADGGLPPLCSHYNSNGCPLTRRKSARA